MDLECSVVVEWYDPTTGTWNERSEAQSIKEAFDKIRAIRKRNEQSLAVSISPPKPLEYRIVETHIITGI